MSTFTDDEYCNFDWESLDVQAIVNHYGLATIDETLRSECLTWLRQHDYRVHQIDCTQGMKAFLQSLGALFRWEEMFGYKLENGRNRSLDALRDGFQVPVPSTGGVVIEMFRPDLIWQEDKDYLMGLLHIACEHSHEHLACGRRFFTLLVLPGESALMGQNIPLTTVPYPHSFNNLFRDPPWRISLREDIQKPEAAALQILDWVPVGTSVAEARRIMEQHHYTCSVVINGAFEQWSGIDYLRCSCQPSVGVVSRQAVLVLVDGKVSVLHVKSKLITSSEYGPTATAPCPSDGKKA